MTSRAESSKEPAESGEAARRRLLRVYRERPRSCCAATCEYEFSPIWIAMRLLRRRSCACTRGTISRFSEGANNACAAKILSRPCLGWVITGRTQSERKPTCHRPSSRSRSTRAHRGVRDRHKRRRAGARSDEGQHLLYQPAELRHRVAHGGNPEGDAPAAGRRKRLQVG